MIRCARIGLEPHSRTQGGAYKPIALTAAQGEPLSVCRVCGVASVGRPGAGHRVDHIHGRHRAARAIWVQLRAMRKVPIAVFELAEPWLVGPVAHDVVDAVFLLALREPLTEVGRVIRDGLTDLVPRLLKLLFHAGVDLHPQHDAKDGLWLGHVRYSLGCLTWRIATPALAGPQLAAATR